MLNWNADQYLKFARERTQPALDLAARVDVDAPARVIDLGCGPGNSTAVVQTRWPAAALTGLDSSSTMLEVARKEFPQHTWIESDVGAWAVESKERFEVVFSNAALQWATGHRRLFPQLLERVSDGGALAVQMPANLDAPPHRLMRELAASAQWRAYFSTPPREWLVHPPEFYYEVLAPRARHIELWATEYIHVLPGLDGIIEWYRGSGLRPWLDALPDDPTRAQFLGAYRARLVAYFPVREDGRVLFPFRRLFVIAYR